MSWKKQFVEMLFPRDASSLDIEDAFSLKYRNLPSSIFKYRAVNENALKNLSDNTVWLAAPRSLNDPYDCTHSLHFNNMSSNLLRQMPQEIADRLLPDRVAEIIESVKNSKNPQETLINKMLIDIPSGQKQKMLADLQKVTDTMFQDMTASVSERLRDSFKLCSFSERVDSTLMWAHYANYHKGFCIEYDVSAIPYSDLTSRFLYPVIYSETPFDATPYFTMGIDEAFNNIHLNVAGLIKAVDWSYEREWRLLFSNEIIKASQTHRMPTPKTVYMGSHINDTDQSKITRICDTKGIPIKKMKHSTSEFSMSPVSINEAN